MNDTEITEENFDKYFFDIRKHKPQKGQTLAKWTAVAEFVDGIGKKDIIKLLKDNRAEQAVQIMEKIHCCKAPWSYKVLIQIAKDLLELDELEVEKKPYEMVIEYLFWTKKEYIPKNDLRWESLSLLEYDKESGEYKSKIEF